MNDPGPNDLEPGVIPSQELREMIARGEIAVDEPVQPGHYNRPAGYEGMRLFLQKKSLHVQDQQGTVSNRRGNSGQIPRR